MSSIPPAAAAGSMTLGGDMPVRRMGFGAMRITGPGIWGEPTDRDNAKRVLRRAVELGVNLIDTADSYGPEVSENLIAEALHPYPAGLILATKGGLTRSGPGEWHRNGKPTHLRRACEGSLKRLRIERIDLYQLHAVDSRVPLEESVGELARLQKEGKVRHVGLSNVSVDQLQQARSVVPIVSVQNRYNVGDRASDDVVDACSRDSIGFLPWRPVGMGELTSSAGTLDKVARRHGATAGQVALAWLLHRSPVMLPIPGTSSIQHLEENVAATALELSDADLVLLARA
jgi:aryl-alcohol dehydrogenase-like predicted oxidoreductase